MKRDIFVDNQRGATLLEALVGLILMTIVGLGLCYAASRSLTSQRYLNTQNIVVSQSRQWLLARTNADIAGACGHTGPSITIGNQTATLNVTCATAGGGNAVVVSAVGKPRENSNGSEPSDKPAQSPANDLTVSINDDSIRTKTILSTPQDDTAAKAMFGGDGRIEVSL